MSSARAPPHLLESIVLSIDKEGYYTPLTPEQEEQQRMTYNATHPAAPILPGPWHEYLHERYEAHLHDHVLYGLVYRSDGELRGFGEHDLKAMRSFLQRVPQLITRPSPAFADGVRQLTELEHVYERFASLWRRR